MPNYFYFDANGQKHGLVNDQQLQALATQGIITPTTPLETEGGHTGVAGQIPGLKFNTASPTAQPAQVASPKQATYYSPPRLSAAHQRASESVSTGTPWLLDFSFQEIRLPKNA